MGKLCLVAIDVRSTHNVGSFLRTADGFGAEVVLCGITPYPKMPNDTRLPHISEKTHKSISKTALGAETSVIIRYFQNPVDSLNSLKKEGFHLIAIEQDKTSIELRSYPFDSTSNYALILGPEVSGLSKQVIERCDGVCEIPMKGTKESFNVSVAAGIALYQASNELVVK